MTEKKQTKRIDAPAADGANIDTTAPKKIADEFELEARYNADLRKLETDAAEHKKKLDADFDRRIDERLAVIDAARAIAPEVEWRGKSDRDVRVAAIVHVDTSFVADGKSDDYVRAMFDSLGAKVRVEQGALARVHVDALDAVPVVTSPVADAAERMRRRHADAWKPRT